MAGLPLAAAKLMLRPTISSASSMTLVSCLAFVVTWRPSRRTVMLSQTSMISLRRWVMNSTAIPEAAISLIACSK